MYRLIFIIILLSMTVTVYASDEDVAMVMNVSGTVLVDGKPIVKLSKLKSDSTIELMDSQASLTVVLMNTNEEYSIQGSNKITIREDSVIDLNGNPLSGKSLLMANVASTKNIEQTAVVMRGLRMHR